MVICIYMSEKKQTIRFKAVKVVNQPTTISFTTKDGKKVSFPAIKAVEQLVSIQFKAKPKK